MNIILLLGSLLGLSSIIMAALMDHSLAAHFTGMSLTSVMTAVRYHQLYAVVVCIIGLSLTHQLNTKMKRWLVRTGFIFTLGTIFFSLGIYISVLFGMSGFLYLTPVGGIILMVGWACLIRSALLKV